jgi:hypothetical protein
MRLVFDTARKKEGWDEEVINWHWLVKASVVNDSDTPTTLENAEATAWVKEKAYIPLLFCKKLPAKYVRRDSYYGVISQTTPQPWPQTSCLPPAEVVP